MTQVLKIAIFGLNTTDLSQLKTQVLLCLPENIQPKWVNIAEEQIDFLFVSDIFFNSVGIQKVLKKSTKRYLRLVKSDHHVGQVIDDQLFYPFSDLKYLNQWMSQQDSVQPKNLEPKMQQPFYLDARDKLPQVLKSNVTLEKVCTEIFTPRNGYIQLFDANGFIALVDTRTERVWVDEGLKVQFTHTLNQTYATAHVVQEKMQAKVVYDLRIWLWSVFSRSSMLQLPPIELSQNFKLEIWPQFEKDISRRDYLKMAACFSQGANINTVKQQLNLPDEKVINFVGTASLLQLGRFIELNEVKFSMQNSSSETAQTNKLKSFFGKLRQKLGL